MSGNFEKLSDEEQAKIVGYAATIVRSLTEAIVAFQGLAQLVEGYGGPSMGAELASFIEVRDQVEQLEKTIKLRQKLVAQP